MINYRILNPDEYDKLEQLFAQQNGVVPYPDCSTVAVAEDEEGEIVGFLVLQMCYHMEPFYLRDPHVSFRRMFTTLNDHVTTNMRDNNMESLVAYSFVDNERVKKMAEMSGFTSTGHEAIQIVLKAKEKDPVDMDANDNLVTELEA